MHSLVACSRNMQSLVACSRQSNKWVGGGYSATNNTTNIMGTKVRHPEKPLTSNKGEAATSAATEVI